MYQLGLWTFNLKTVWNQVFWGREKINFSDTPWKLKLNKQNALLKS